MSRNIRKRKKPQKTQRNKKPITEKRHW